jgi:LmbE family N-acetylglucosaminyl deacetylase
MATMVTFHAHPDDECITCGGVMRKAYEDGHRVVLVVATRGELGEVADDFLGEGEELWQRRVKETHEAAGILGATRVEFLGYTDSGMMGEPTNDAPGTFWTADVEEAAGKLAEILREEDAEVLTVYDDHGGYGHPDHIQVHRVGMRAAELAGTPRVYQATMNRDAANRARSAFVQPDSGFEPPEFDETFGSPESILTTKVDVSKWVTYKRQAMRAHASQISEQSFFLAMPDEVFGMAFGTEWFIRVGAEPGIDEFELL